MRRHLHHIESKGGGIFTIDFDVDAKNKQRWHYYNTHSIWRRLLIPLLFAAVVVLLLTRSYFTNTIILPSAASSDPKERYNTRTEGLLNVISKYKRPIILATIRGYLNDDGCTTLHEHRHDNNNSSDNAIATITLLSENEPSDDYDTPLYQFGAAKRRLGTNNNNNNNNWETNFHLNIRPPSPLFEQGDLCFEVYWRVEYVGYESAISDFPSRTCSFRGTPTFHRSWNWTDFNNPKGLDNGPNNAKTWLVRKSHEDRWMSSAHYEGNILKDGTRSSCSTTSWQERDYSIVIIGDSQPYYMCQHLMREMRSSSSSSSASNNLRCVQIKQTLGNEKVFQAYANEFQNATENVVIFNPSGLWEAAYGSIDLFRENFQRLLDHIPSGRKHRQTFFSAPTTAVHPIVYGNLANDDKKWSMTQVRVREINAVAERLVLNETKRRVGDTISLRVLPTPIDALSLNSEDDPKTPGDMRHFGKSTNEMLLEAILCDLD